MIILATMWACGCDAAQVDPTTALPLITPVAPRTAQTSEMIDLTIASVALARDAHVRVILPAGYDRNGPRAYPVLYLLHGANEPLGYTAWSMQSEVARFAHEHALLVVMPEGGQAGWYSNWQRPCTPDEPRAPAWEDFHTDELPRILREHFRASERSAIAGLSMGGMGALSYAARHSGEYAAAAAYSGAVHLQPVAAIVRASLLIAGCEQGDELWGDPEADAATWAEHDPYALAEHLLELPTYLASGDGEPGPLDPAGAGRDGLEALALAATRDMAERLASLGASACESHYYGAGTHSWPYWNRELERSLPTLLEALGVK